MKTLGIEMDSPWCSVRFARLERHPLGRPVQTATAMSAAHKHPATNGAPGVNQKIIARLTQRSIPPALTCSSMNALTFEGLTLVDRTH